jgi:hypothetical protein
VRYFELVVFVAQSCKLGLEIACVSLLSFTEGSLSCSILCSSTLLYVSVLSSCVRTLGSTPDVACVLSLVEDAEVDI